MLPLEVVGGWCEDGWDVLQEPALQSGLDEP
jgi:hypothetical protein